MIYATISIDDLNKIDFSQIGETSADTIRRSIDLTQFVIKWNSEPTFIEDDVVIPIGVYSHANVLTLMATNEWSEPFINE
tara:strand:- start:1178 stop:1417 length:240 start_codon:yes stop_codon:yes gene_type:complete